MSKEEFIQKLGEALAGEVSQGVIQENIRYYDSYISDEMRKGNSEEEVTASIGDPRLIARTIIDSTVSAEESGSSSYSGSTYSGYSQDAGQSGESTRRTQSFHTVDLSKWYWKVLAVVVIFMIVSLVVTVIGGIFSILAPFVMPALVIWLIFSLIRGPRR